MASYTREAGKLGPGDTCQPEFWYFSGSIGEGNGTPTPVLLPGKSHGWRSLVGCSPWGREESDTTERLRFPFSLSCIGEGNGNPLQCSCLENSGDGGAWRAAVYGVAQSGTPLKDAAAALGLFGLYCSKLLFRCSVSVWISYPLFECQSYGFSRSHVWI